MPDAKVNPLTACLYRGASELVSPISMTPRGPRLRRMAIFWALHRHATVGAAGRSDVRCERPDHSRNAKSDEGIRGLCGSQRSQPAGHARDHSRAHWSEWRRQNDLLQSPDQVPEPNRWADHL